jgi:hypothetical protein
MSYIGFLISNFTTGFDQERKPWLLPDDSQDQLLDGFIYKGVWQKRKGYSQFATGERLIVNREWSIKQQQLCLEQELEHS